MKRLYCVPIDKQGNPGTLQSDLKTQKAYLQRIKYRVKFSNISVVHFYKGSYLKDKPDRIVKF